MIDVSSGTDTYIDQLEDEIERLREILLEISKFEPVTDSVDAHSVSYAAQLAKEALGLAPKLLGTQAFTSRQGN